MWPSGGGTHRTRAAHHDRCPGRAWNRTARSGRGQARPTWSFALRRPRWRTRRPGSGRPSGARGFLSLPDYSLALLGSESLQVDFDALVPQAEALAAQLDAGRAITLHSPLGTRLTLDISGRQANCCPGVRRTPGSLGSPPDAEVNVAPLEHSAHGVAWIDGSVPCPGIGRLAEPIRLDIDGGRLYDSRDRRPSLPAWRPCLTNCPRRTPACSPSSASGSIPGPTSPAACWRMKAARARSIWASAPMPRSAARMRGLSSGFCHAAAVRRGHCDARRGTARPAREITWLE